MMFRRFVPGILALPLFLACAQPATDAAAPALGMDTTTADVAKPTPIPRLLPEPWAEQPLVRTEAPAPEIAARAAVVIDEASAAVLFEKDAHASLPLASLTKIVTAIIAIEQGRLEDIVESDVDSTTMRGSTVMGLLPGDGFLLRDLLYGLILPSGNDAALAIGRHIAGSDAAFVGMMNAFTRSIGLRESSFANPHGLGGGGTQAASAYDIAMFSRYAMTLPEFRQVVTTPGWTATGTRTIELRNINGFLYQYAGADGIKTGYTRSAGSTLAASATRSGHRLYAIVLNSEAREDDVRLLLDWAFANYCWPDDPKGCGS